MILLQGARNLKLYATVSVSADGGRSDRRHPGKDRLPLWTHGCVAYAVETEDEQTLKVDRNYEHRLQHTHM